MDHTIGALTDCVICPVMFSHIQAAVRDRPRLEETFWWDLLVATAIEREHILSLGRDPELRYPPRE